MRTTLLHFAGAVLILVCVSTRASADPYTIQPNGDIIFHVVQTTQGTFTCGSQVACNGSGTNAVTISSGGGSATFTFTGVNSTFDVGNVAIPVTLGTITGSSTSDFSLAGFNPGIQLFSLMWSITHTSPGIGTRNLDWGVSASFARISGRTVAEFSSGFTPPQYAYSLVYDQLDFSGPVDPNGSVTIEGQVGAAPEPASMVLLGSGLVGVALQRRRRRRMLQ